MLVKHQFSNDTWGRVLSLRDDETRQVAQRPNKTKTLTHSEDVTIEIAPSDPDAAKLFAPMTIKLGQKTWAKEVPDIDPLWQEWLDGGRITEDLLTDVPEPTEDVAARELAAAKAAKESEVKAELAKQEQAKLREAHPELYKSLDDLAAATTVEDVAVIVVQK